MRELSIFGRKVISIQEEKRGLVVKLISRFHGRPEKKRFSRPILTQIRNIATYN